MEALEEVAKEENEILGPFHLLSFRVTHPDIIERFDYYYENIQRYLKVKGYEIMRSTGGLHLNCSCPHFHYHLQIKPRKIPASIIQDWKYFWKNDKKINKKEIAIKDYVQRPCLFSFCVGISKKINISIRYSKEKEKEGVDKFLNYPLKEKTPLPELVFNVPDILERAIIANTLYLNTIHLKKTKEARKSQQLSLRNALINFVEKQIDLGYSSVDELLRSSLDHARDLDEYHHPRRVVEVVQTILYKKRIWDLDRIMEKYYL